MPSANLVNRFSFTKSMSALGLVAIAGLTACYPHGQPAVVQTEVPEITHEENLGVDDIFEVRVYGEAELTGLFQVTTHGTIDYPLVGRVTVVGKSSEEVQQLLAQRLSEYVKRPQVSVMVKEWNSRKVSVLGQVQKPGPIRYFSRMTIVDAIASAGGFTGIAAKNSVTLRRERQSGQVESRNYPVEDITAGKSPNVILIPGDVLVVEERIF